MIVSAVRTFCCRAAANARPQISAAHGATLLRFLCSFDDLAVLQSNDSLGGLPCQLFIVGDHDERCAVKPEVSQE